MTDPSPFFQTPPRLGNQFDDDRLLADWLRWRLPPDVLADIRPGLERLGGRVVGDVADMARRANAEPPVLESFDPWGRRVDHIRTSAGWEALHGVAAEEGIVATAYERAHGPWSRAHQFARLYLFNPSSAIYSCPLAMTDGAARVLELLGDEDLRDRALPRLTARDPGRFWTSGQWMTERTGGSDVSGTSTVAEPDPGGNGFRLYGDKWFTSATTADMALTLATQADRPGLSLYYLETRDDQGRMNAIRVHRLKDKLGTRAMPTAELTLDGTPARLVGEAGRGVRNIATMLNITRLYNAVCAVSYMRRGYALARDYADRRHAFGRRLIDLPLHRETLADMATEHAAGLHLVFHLALLLGREETGEADAADRALLRLLTPVAKLYTGRQTVAVASEVLEAFGGAGYIEDTGLPMLLRDAQVLAIWEGTTNVLSLDVQRVLAGGEALAVFGDDVRRRLASVTRDDLAGEVAQVGGAVARLAEHAQRLMAADAMSVEAGARDFAFGLARIHAAALLLEHAQWAADHGGDETACALARRWCARPLTAFRGIDAGHLAQTAHIVDAESYGNR